MLDEIKRIEDDNREAFFRLNFKQQDGFRNAKYETNPKEPFLMNAPHESNHTNKLLFEYEVRQPSMHMGAATANSSLDYLLNNLEMMKEQCDQEQKRLGLEIAAQESSAGYPSRMASNVIRQIEIKNGEEVLTLPELPKNPQPIANKMNTKNRMN